MWFTSMGSLGRLLLPQQGPALQLVAAAGTAAGATAAQARGEGASTVQTQQAPQWWLLRTWSHLPAQMCSPSPALGAGTPQSPGLAGERR